jgi:hypothetical protein
MMELENFKVEVGSVKNKEASSVKFNWSYLKVKDTKISTPVQLKTEFALLLTELALLLTELECWMY